MGKQKIETGSSKLFRHHMFNKNEQDIDVPDGDVEYGRQLYKVMCAGCHGFERTGNLGPKLANCYGGMAGIQPDFGKVGSSMVKGKTFHHAMYKYSNPSENSQEYFGLQSAMIIPPMQDPYQRASIIEYMHHVRLTHFAAGKKKPHWLN